jgi:hypothetical protein
VLAGASASGRGVVSDETRELSAVSGEEKFSGEVGCAGIVTPSGVGATTTTGPVSVVVDRNFSDILLLVSVYSIRLS